MSFKSAVQSTLKKIFSKSIILTAAAFVLTAGVLLAFSQRMGLFVVKRVPVALAPAGSEDQSQLFKGSGLRERLEAEVKPFTGKRIWEIDIDSLRASIVKDQWVQDVLISRTFPNSLNVRVTQKNPILVMVGAKGTFSPITEEGEVLGELPPGSLPDVPLLRSEGLGKDAAEIEKRRIQIVEFVKALPEKGILTRKNISEISWNREDGINLTIIQPRAEVKLGDDRPELKILRVTQVLNYLAQHQLKERVIDASFSKKVLVRLRKGP